MKAWLGWVWRWGVALGLLYWALRDIPWTLLPLHLARLPGTLAAGWLLLNAGVVALLALRWWWILRALGAPLPFAAVLRYRLAALGFNYFSPGPQVGGEPFKVWWLVKHRGLAPETALVSVVLDKGYEVVSSGTVLVVGLVVSARVLGHASTGVLLGALAPLVLSGGYPWLLSRGYRPLAAAVARRYRPSLGDDEPPGPRGRRWPRVARGLAAAVRVEEALATFFRQQARTAWGMYLFSLFLWALTLGEYVLMWRLVGLPLPWDEAFTAFTAVRLAVLSPLPGDAGVLEAGQRWVAIALGLGAVHGITAALLIRLRDLLFAGTGLLLGLHLTRR